MQERLTIVDRKQGNRIARALKDSFNGICSFNDTLTRSGNGESLRREPPKFMMTNNDTGLQLGSQSSRTNSSPPPPPPPFPGRRPNLIPRILFTRYEFERSFHQVAASLGRDVSLNESYTVMQNLTVRPQAPPPGMRTLEKPFAMLNLPL